MLYSVSTRKKLTARIRAFLSLRRFFVVVSPLWQENIGIYDEVMDLGNPLSACVWSRLLRLCAGVEMNGKLFRIVTWACIDHLRLWLGGVEWLWLTLQDVKPHNEPVCCVFVYIQTLDRSLDESNTHHRLWTHHKSPNRKFQQTHKTKCIGNLKSIHSWRICWVTDE